jgi:hypothetical protein
VVDETRVPRWLLRSQLMLLNAGGDYTARVVSRVSASCAVAIDSTLHWPPQPEPQSERASRIKTCEDFDCAVSHNGI